MAAARNLGQAGFYPQACFHCQQSVEKGLKALLLKKSNSFPKIHSLRELADAAGVLSELKELIAVIEVDHTAPRYIDVGGMPVRMLYGREKFVKHL
ncbi:HEPN domain-containing protein [Candidatus Micrarchaeota archaeon]|nr:HEPN domain-containing protein [Candidatus Micrarchaeota archaeon]MBI5176980.1 HEPN domain-containing protein [Candidatus Micrarchaeota archaeon]